jgi:hypothetical protein
MFHSRPLAVKVEVTNLPLPMPQREIGHLEIVGGLHRAWKLDFSKSDTQTIENAEITERRRALFRENIPVDSKLCKQYWRTEIPRTLPRVPGTRGSQSSPSVALGEEKHSRKRSFPECRKTHGTRGRVTLRKENSHLTAPLDGTVCQKK